MSQWMRRAPDADRVSDAAGLVTRPCGIALQKRKVHPARSVFASFTGRRKPCHEHVRRQGSGDGQTEPERFFTSGTSSLAMMASGRVDFGDDVKAELLMCTGTTRHRMGCQDGEDRCRVSTCASGGEETSPATAIPQRRSRSHGGPQGCTHGVAPASGESRSSGRLDRNRASVRRDGSVRPLC
jgi:hypothetical protein